MECHEAGASHGETEPKTFSFQFRGFNGLRFLEVLFQHPTHVEITVIAPAELVYEMLASLTRKGDWSHECVRCRWIGVTHPEVSTGSFPTINRGAVHELTGGRAGCVRTVRARVS